MKAITSIGHIRSCFAAILLFTSALSNATSISGFVADDSGNALPSASVLINGHAATLEQSGAFSAVVGPQDIYTLNISASGYYSFIQTYSRADLDQLAGDALEVPVIKLVAKTKGRRLLVFGGDAMMARRFLEPRAGEPVLVRAENAEADMKSVLQHVRPYLQLAEFASVNLETQLSSAPLTETLPKSVVFLTDPAIVAALKWAGVDYVALGNNHTFDFLDAGLTRTLAALQEAGMAFSGAGADDALARTPHIAEVAGSALHLYSYVGWPGTFEPNQVASETKGGAALGTAASIVSDMQAIPASSLGVMQYHSGLEYVSVPPLAEETQLKLAIDNGADLAIGHHSHVIQGFEVYKGKLLAYSLGNFVFDQYLPSTHAAMLLFAWYDDDRFYRAEIVPLHLNSYVPTPATGVMRYDILQRLARLSENPDTCLDSSGGHLVVKPCMDGAVSPGGQVLAAGAADSSRTVHRLSSLEASPIPPVVSVSGASSYRLGLDRLPQGNFESIGLFDTVDRTWIEHPNVAIVGEGPKEMRLELQKDAVIATGMKVFTRVFTRSNPATVSANVSADDCATLRFKLQRRPVGMSLSDALADGPVSEIGQLTIDAGVTNAELSFQLPRLSSRSIRLLFEAEACADSDTPVTLAIDDLALVEWQTPWIDAGVDSSRTAGVQATHVQILQ